MSSSRSARAFPQIIGIILNSCCLTFSESNILLNNRFDERFSLCCFPVCTCSHNGLSHKCSAPLNVDIFLPKNLKENVLSDQYLHLSDIFVVGEFKEISSSPLCPKSLTKRLKLGQNHPNPLYYGKSSQLNSENGEKFSFVFNPTSEGWCYGKGKELLTGAHFTFTVTVLLPTRKVSLPAHALLSGRSSKSESNFQILGHFNSPPFSISENISRRNTLSKRSFPDDIISETDDMKNALKNSLLSLENEDSVIEEAIRLLASKYSSTSAVESLLSLNKALTGNSSSDSESSKSDNLSSTHSSQSSSFSSFGSEISEHICSDGPKKNFSNLPELCVLRELDKLMPDVSVETRQSLADCLFHSSPSSSALSAAIDYLSSHGMPVPLSSSSRTTTSSSKHNLRSNRRKQPSSFAPSVLSNFSMSPSTEKTFQCFLEWLHGSNNLPKSSEQSSSTKDEDPHLQPSKKIKRSHDFSAISFLADIADHMLMIDGIKPT